MISRAVLARSICLRCQLRLLDRPRALSPSRIPPLRSEFLQRRYYSSESAWDRLEADSHTQKAEKHGRKSARNDEQTKAEVERGLDENIEQRQDPAPVEDHTGSSGKDETEPSTAKGDGTLLFKKTWADKKDVRRVRGRVVNLKHAVLPGKALGKVARAVVMRDSKRALRKLPVEPMDAQKPVNLAADLERQAQDLTTEQSLANIEEMRPSDPILYTHEFDELLQNLLKGFTVFQLRSYLMAASKTALKRPAREGRPMYSCMRDTKCEPWAPLRKLKITGSPKERIALTLLTEAWGLQIREYVDGKGVFNPRIKTQFLRMLSREKKRIDAIRKTYLDAGEKLLIGQSSIKIIATKAKTDTIMKELEQAAENMVVQIINTSWIHHDDEVAGLLGHLGQLTNTSVTHSSQEKINQINLAWFRDGPEQGGQERRADVVQRLLFTALRPTKATVHLNGPKDTECPLVPMVLGRERLSWVDKLTQWSRWAKPVSRDSDPEPDIGLKLEHVLRNPIEAPPQESNIRGKSKAYTATTASFGHILHKNADTFGMAAAAHSSPHIFSPTSPPPASLAVLSERLKSSKPVTTSLVLTFRPIPSAKLKPELSILGTNTTNTIQVQEPEESNKLETDHPDLLELQLTIPDDLPEGPLTWDSCPKRLVVIADQHHTDVSLPYQPIDLRISQSELSVMSASALDDSPFREYIDNAKLDLLAGQLGPPPKIRIADMPFQGQSKPPSKPTDYMFTGLEMRRTLEADYEGHKLLYTSVQAGHHGGRRAEMVLEALPAEPSLSPEEQSAHAANFLRLAQDIAQGKVVEWVGEKDAEAESQRRLAAAEAAAEPQNSDSSV